MFEQQNSVPAILHGTVVPTYFYRQEGEKNDVTLESGFYL
jgi:hypothetical protein